MELINDIEELRIKQGLTLTEMGAQFDVPYQNYNNWVARGSLPKKYIPKAQQILANSGHPKGLDIEVMDIYSRLSPAGKKAAMQSLLAIESLENKP